MSHSFTILLKNIYYHRISCSKVLHFSFRIQLENQSSSLNPAQDTVATRLSGMSDENGDHGRLEVQTRQQPRTTDCGYTMLSQSTMVCATIYAKIRINNLNWQHIKKKELLGPLLYLCLIDDIFFDNLIVMTVNPVQTKPFSFPSGCSYETRTSTCICYSYGILTKLIRVKQ